MITKWFNSTIDPNNPKQNQGVASLLYYTAFHIQEFSLGNRSNNIEIAIASSQNALTVYIKDAFPQYWAQTQNNLANAYLKLSVLIKILALFINYSRNIIMA